MPGLRRPTFVVFDIDGVLADVGHRLHYLASRPKDWPGFFRSASDDPPLDDGVQRAFAAHADGHTIVYLTGRPENYRTATQGWLTSYGLPQGALHMRRSNDHRPARFTKIAVLRELAKAGEIVEFVDDDADVVAAASTAGFNVHHATWMVVTTVEQGELFDAQDVEGRS
jgi:phosphoglycolate phosphatase-like HAD superfamily hydrolase